MMQTRSQRRFAIFLSLCNDMLKQRGEDLYDRVPLTEVLRCTTYREVWRRVVVPYSRTYYGEDIADAWEKAGHLAIRQELSDGSQTST